MPRRHFPPLVVPPWSAGSLGDEYMTLAAWHEVARICGGADIADLTCGGGDETYRETIGPWLPPHVSFVRLGDHRSATLTPHPQIVAIGADTLDGVHCMEFSRETLLALQSACLQGKRVTICSVSYSGNSHPEIDRLVPELEPVRWIARDRRSYERLREIGAHHVELGADFSALLPRCLRPEQSPLVKAGACVVSIAVNEAMERIYGLDLAVDAIADVLERLATQRSGVEAIVLSHDYRVFGPRPHTAVARDFAERLARKLSRLSVRFLDERLQAGHALQLARSSCVVISGFMHYALMASFAGTPGYFIAYHDKGLGQREHNRLFEVEVGGLSGLWTFAAAFARRRRGFDRWLAQAGHRRLRKRTALALQRGLNR